MAISYRFSEKPGLDVFSNVDLDFVEKFGIDWDWLQRGDSGGNEQFSIGSEDPF